MNKLVKKLLNLIDAHFQNKRYHLLYVNLNILILILEKNNDISETNYLRSIDIYYLYSILLDKLYSEFNFREKLHSLAKRLKASVPLSMQSNAKLTELINEKISSSTNINHKSNCYARYEFLEWTDVPGVRDYTITSSGKEIPNPYPKNPDEHDVLIYQLQVVLNEESSKDLVSRAKSLKTLFICQLATILPYLLIAFIKYPSNNSYRIGIQALINQLLTDEKLNQIDLSNQWYYVYAYFLAFESYFDLKIDLVDLTPETLAQQLWPISERYSSCQQVIALQQAANLLKNSPPHQASLILTAANIINKLSVIQQNSNSTWDESNYRLQLKNSRKHFKNQNPIAAQKNCTQDTIKLLQAIFFEAKTLLGQNICNTALLVVGSTSYQIRMPYSDIELAMLHVPLANAKTGKAQCLQQRAYLSLLSKLCELTIIYLNETPSREMPQNNSVREGFRIDSSTHFIVKELINEPVKLIDLKIKQLIADNISSMVKDESIFSLFKPMLVNPEVEHSLLAPYQKATNNYLDQNITDSQQKVLENIFLKEIIHNDKPEINIFDNTVQLQSIPFTYRQAAALYCLVDILQESVKEIAVSRGELEPYKKDQSVGFINIKKAYYKPLAYLGLCLRLYHNWETNIYHPYDLLIKAEQVGLFGPGLGSLLRAALKEIVKLRINLHRIYKKQAEIIELNNKLAEEILTDNDNLTLKIIEEGVIYPLKRILEVTLAHQHQINWKTIFTGILSSYTEQRKAWQNESCYKQDRYFHPLIQILADYPGPDGWSPAYTLLKQQWLKKIEIIFDKKESGCIIQGHPEIKELCFLPQDAVEKLFDLETGRLKNEYNYLNIPDTRLVTFDDKIFLLQFITLENFHLLNNKIIVSELQQCLGGQPLLPLGQAVKFTVNLSNKQQKISHWAWLMLIPEDSKPLVTMLRKQQNCLDKIERENYSQHFLLTYLLLSETKALDEWLLQQVNHQYHITNLGYPHIINDIDSKKLNIHTGINLIYLLNNLCDPISPATTERIQQIDIDRLIDALDKKLEKYNSFYTSLFGNELKPTNIESIEQSHYQIVTSKFMLDYVRLRLKPLQKLLTQTFELLSHNTILNLLDPETEILHRNFIGIIKQPSDFSKITAVCLENKQKHGYLDAHIHLQASHFDYINFEKIQINNEPDIKRQSYLLQLMQTVSFTKLNLQTCVALTDDILIKLVKNSPNLNSINLLGCQNITEKGWLEVLKHCKKLQFVAIGKNSNLISLNNHALSSLLGLGKQLKFIMLDDCPNLISVNVDFNNVFIFYVKCPKLILDNKYYKIWNKKIIQNFDIISNFIYNLALNLNILETEDLLGIYAFGVMFSLRTRQVNFFNEIVKALDKKLLEAKEYLGKNNYIKAFKKLLTSIKINFLLIKIKSFLAVVKVENHIEDNELEAHIFNIKSSTNFENIKDTVKPTNNQNELLYEFYLNFTKGITLNTYSNKALNLNPSNDDSLKIVLLGASGSGKTACAEHYVGRPFRITKNSTLGVDFIVNELYLCGKYRKLKIWDIGGTERFRSFAQYYIRGASAVLLFYDITDIKSIQKISEFNKLFKENFDEFNMPPKVLVGTKTDLVQMRKTSIIEGEILAETIGASLYLECSAKTGKNVHELFTSTAEIAYIENGNQFTITNKVLNRLFNIINYNHSSIYIQKFLVNIINNCTTANPEAIYYAQTGLGFIRFAQGQYEQADELLTSSRDIALQQNDDNICLIQGIGFTNLKAYEQAHACYDILLTENPNHVIALLLKGRSYLQQNKMYLTLSCWRKALHINKNQNIDISLKNIMAELYAKKRMSACQLLSKSRTLFQVLRDPIYEESLKYFDNYIMTRIIKYIAPLNYLSHNEQNQIINYAKDKNTLLKHDLKQIFLKRVIKF